MTAFLQVIGVLFLTAGLFLCAGSGSVQLQIMFAALAVIGGCWVGIGMGVRILQQQREN